MTISLKVSRKGAADDCPLSFKLVKPIPFDNENIAIIFSTEVWCSDSELANKANKIRIFIDNIGRDHKSETSIRFDGPQKVDNLRCHQGMCKLHLSKTTDSKLVVLAVLKSPQIGASESDLVDSCAIHFQTSIDFLEDFSRQLENSSDDSVSALFEGVDFFQS